MPRLTRIPHARREPSAVWRAVLAVSLGMICGCQNGLTTGSGPRTQSDRLMAAYPDLASGRFWVVADFEELKHAELFRVISHSGQAACIPVLAGGVSETGPRCLRVTLADPLDALVISSAGAKTWTLKRDWHEFLLLNAAVFCTVDQTDLELSLVAGAPSGGSTAESRVTLHRGWNLLRLDLTEAAEHVPIDDIREVRLTLPEADGPIELLLDDLVLADNREDLFGSATDPNEGLYVQRQGRRWNIGAAGRFELGFANGQIVHWYDLGNDPLRLMNLVRGGVLGPSPVVLPGAGGDWLPGEKSDFAALGETVVARQQVIEANPVRIVISCWWWFTSPGVPVAADAPFQHWTYTVYADGRVFVHIECTSADGDWQPPALGLVVSHIDDGRVKPFAHSAAQLSDPEELRHVTYGGVRPIAPDKSGLLFAVHDSRRAPLMEAPIDPLRKRVDLLASGGELSTPTSSWSCMLSVWPPGNCDEIEARTRTLDYCYPGGTHVLVGEPVADAPGDANNDGFDEQHGCYVLRPEANLLRFEIDGTKRPKFQPAFTVLDTAGRDAWVYFNNVIVDAVVRDPEGNVVFQLPTAVRGPGIVEVVLRDRTAE